MIFLTLTIVLVSFVVGLNKYKTVINPLGLFNILWAIVIALQPFSDFFGVYHASQQALNIVYIGVISFDLGTIIFGKIPFVKRRKNNFIYVVNEKLLRVLIFISVLYLVISSISSINRLLTGTSFSTIRIEYFTYDKNNWNYYLRNFIFLPLQYVTLIATFLSLRNKKIDKFLLFSAIVTVVLQVLQSGGRYVLLNSVYMLIVTSYIFHMSEKLNKKMKLIIVIALALLFYGIISLTGLRFTNFTESMTWYERVLNVFYSYFAGSITYMGKLVNMYPSIKGSSYGLNFIAGFLNPLFSALTFLKIIPYPHVFNIIGEYATVQIAIGKLVYYNAMPTLFMYFYIDFGMVGVCLESVLLGIIAVQSYKHMKLEMDWISIGYYLLISVLLLNSSQRWFLYNPGFALSFVYLRIVCRRKGVIRENAVFDRSSRL